METTNENKSSPKSVLVSKKFRVEIIREYEQKENLSEDGCDLEMDCQNESDYLEELKKRGKSDKVVKTVKKPTMVIEIDLDDDNEEDTVKTTKETLPPKATKSANIQPQTTEIIKSTPALEVTPRKKAKVKYTDGKSKRKKRKRSTQDDYIDLRSSSSESGDDLDTDFAPKWGKKAGKMEGVFDHPRPRRKAAQNVALKMKPWWERLSDEESEAKEEETKEETGMEEGDKGKVAEGVLEKEEEVSESSDYKVDSDEESEEISDDADTPSTKISKQHKQNKSKEDKTNENKSMESTTEEKTGNDLELPEKKLSVSEDSKTEAEKHESSTAVSGTGEGDEADKTLGKDVGDVKGDENVGTVSKAEQETLQNTDNKEEDKLTKSTANDGLEKEVEGIEEKKEQ